jgi:tRNA 2-selenouridine synthase
MPLNAKLRKAYSFLSYCPNVKDKTNLSLRLWNVSYHFNFKISYKKRRENERILFLQLVMIPGNRNITPLIFLYLRPMSPSLSISEFLLASSEFPVVDVRSPGEYEKGHIPGAHNIPLFTNEERALVGTKYKRAGKDPAVLLGLEIVGPKMADFVRQASALSAGRKLLVHCWRGGMRSSSFAWLLNTSGIEAVTLRQGYKAYRRHVLKSFEKNMNLVILGGETGSGKTEILHQLAAKGEQVIDLEGLACHRGSSFGALGQLPQPGVEAFENLFSETLLRMNPIKRIWVEDESKSIGRVFIPDAFWEQMKTAPFLRVEVPRTIRVERLVKEYGAFQSADLEAALTRIQKRLGGLAFKQCLEALSSGDMATVAEITLDYYDKAYNFSKEKNKIAEICMDQDNPALAAEKIIRYADTNDLSGLIPVLPATGQHNNRQGKTDPL